MFRPAWKAARMTLRTTLVSALLVASVGLFAACGKATVKPGHAAAGFSVASLRAGSSALIVDARPTLSDLTPSYQSAFADRFGDGDSLASYLAARLLDSLNGGTPAVPAALAPALNPRHILHVRDLVIARTTREVPKATLPSGAQSSPQMEPAGGGTSEGWSVTFTVDVWETSGILGEAEDEPGVAAPDSAAGKLRFSFAVTGQADVPLYAYKSALTEALNVAANAAVRHLRGP